MTKYAFQVGDVVAFHSSTSRSEEGTYEVTRQLPADGPEPAYRLKGISAVRERVAQEHELRGLKQGTQPAVEPGRDLLKPGRSRPSRRPAS